MMKALPRAGMSAMALAVALSWTEHAAAQTLTIEQIASDAAPLGVTPPGGTGAALIPNNWGGHQSRIVRQSDESILAVYLINDQGTMKWKLRHRPVGGGWVDVGTPTQSNDDVSLLRDAAANKTYVLAWPASVPTLYPADALQSPVVIPGKWPYQLPKNRQYQSTGIGADGTICMKVATEPGITTATQTSQVNTVYSCGTFDQAVTSNWSPLITHYIGLRYVYDYLHVNPPGRPAGLYGVPKADLYKTVSNVPNSAKDYVKNGIRGYSTGTTSDANWTQFDIVHIIKAPQGATVAPEAVAQDVLVDTKGRTFVSYHLTDPVALPAGGNFVYVSDANDNTVYQGPWGGDHIEAYGSSRFYEDSNGRLWLLWYNQGNRRPEVKLYPIVESGTHQFSLGTAVDLGPQFGEIVPDGTGYAFYFAAPRGGNSRGLYIDALFNACGSLSYNTDHQTKVDLSTCYTQGMQKVYYVRIPLPN